MVDTTGTGTVPTSQVYNDYNYCWHRLPCGRCKLTMDKCPEVCGDVGGITWTTMTDVGKDTARKITGMSDATKNLNRL